MTENAVKSCLSVKKLISTSEQRVEHPFAAVALITMSWGNKKMPTHYPFLCITSFTNAP